jgi:hypothetical protein
MAILRGSDCVRDGYGPPALTYQQIGPGGMKEKRKQDAESEADGDEGSFGG